MKYLHFIFVVLFTVSSATAFDLESSRGPGAGRTLMLSSSRALDLASVPTGGIDSSAYRFDFGYNRRFELSDLDQLYIAGAYRYRNFSFAVGALQFGQSDLYSEKTFKTTVAYSYRRYVFGLTGSTRLYEFGGDYANLSASTLGLGGAARWSKIFVAAAIDNLTRPRLYDGADPTEITFSLHGEVIGKGNISTLANIRLQKGYNARLALGQRIPLSAVAGIYWGVATEPLEYGAGLDIGVQSFDLSYMVSIHPTLGLTHTIGLGIGPKKPKAATKGEFE